MRVDTIVCGTWDEMLDSIIDQYVKTDQLYISIIL